MVTSSISQSFLNAIAETGIRPPQAVVIDGKFRRFPKNVEPGDT